VLAIFMLQATLASLAIAWIASTIREARRERREARQRFEAARAPAGEGRGEVAGRVEAQDDPAKGAVVVEVQSRVERVWEPPPPDPITAGVIRNAPVRFVTRAREVRLAPFAIALDDGRRVAVRADTELTLLAPPRWNESSSGWLAISGLRAGERALVRGVLQRAAGDGDYRQAVDAWEIGASGEQRLVIESSAQATAIAREKGPGLLAPALALVGLALAGYVDRLPPPPPWARHLTDLHAQMGTVVDTSSRGLSVDLGADKLVYVPAEHASHYRIGQRVIVTCDLPLCEGPGVVSEPPEVADPRFAEGAGAMGCFVLAFVALAVRAKRRHATAQRRLATW
jgi:hypothetical protein